MADTVSSKVLTNTPKRLVIQIQNLSDGTGESAVTKVDKSTYTGLNGLEPSFFAVERIEGDAVGMEVYIYCDRTSAVPIARLGGLGKYKIDYRRQGGLQTGGAGGTGDILLTTNGQSLGDSYNIVLHLRKKD